MQKISAKTSNSPPKKALRIKPRYSKREILAGLAFILPGFIGFFLFYLIPVVLSLGLSFTEWNFLRGWDAMKFVGIDNFKRMLTDDWFKVSLLNNIKFTLISVPALIIVGLIFAYIINKLIYFGEAVRSMMFIPYIASVVAVCIVWMVMFQPNYGPINEFLRMVGVENPPGWLTSPKWSLYTITFIYIWQQLGYYIIVYVAGLKSIPAELYESAQIDGASSVRQFFSITVPMVSPTTFFLTTMGIISSFKVFDHISVLTNGGPGNSSSVMAFYIYRTAFENFQMGYANALAWVLFIAIFIITLLQMRGQANFTAE
jgi:multiple sugar transport system permease protein